MVAILALVVSIATITLLAFGERLGLPADIVGLFISAILGFFILTIALASTTTRLAVHLDASDNPSTIRPLAIQLVLVVAGLVLLPDATMSDPRPGIAMLLAYLVTLILVPSREPTSLLPEAERRMGGPERSSMLGLISIGFAGLLFVTWFEPARAWLAAASGIRPDIIHTLMITSFALVVLLGGLVALSRLAEGALAFALLFAGLPLLVALGLDAFHLSDLVSTLNAGERLARFGASLPGLLADRSLIPAVLTGTGLGLISLASTPGLGGPLRRGGFGLLVASMAALAAFGFAHEAGALPALVARDLIPAQPQNWPLFVFDDSIRGWLLVCKEAPRDAIDVIQACRRSGVSGAIPPEMFVIRPNMIGPALAASRNIPVTFGLVSGLLGPFFVLVTLALLLHVAASGFAETVLYRFFWPRTLRAARLARARMSVVGILLPFVFLSADQRHTDVQLVTWLMLSLALLLAMTLLADWMLALLSYARQWRRDPVKPETTSLPAQGGA